MHEIPEDVHSINLGSKMAHGQDAVFRLKKLIRRYRPDIVFSTVTWVNVAVCFLSLFIKQRIIVRESNIVSLLLSKSFMRRVLWIGKIYGILIRGADLIIVQSWDMQEDLSENFAVKPDRMVLINNPVNVDLIQRKAQEEVDIPFKGNKFVVSVGRLVYQKGYDLLINSFSKIDTHLLLIIGQGSEEKNLKEMVRRLNLEDRVKFLGFQDNPYKYMARADFLVSSSRFEGFPNVVLESLACGVPVIANDYKGGIREILDEGEGIGEIIDITDAEAFRRSLSKRLAYDSRKIVAYCRKKYSLEAIVRQYESTLCAVAG
jgi:glycosyltransferase involved in cell wall biosynthesis